MDGEISPRMEFNPRPLTTRHGRVVYPILVGCMILY